MTKKPSLLQMQKLVEKVFESFKKHKVIIFKDDEKKVFARALQAVRDDFQREADLEKEVYRMIEDLERQHGSSFEKNKMFHMLKQKLAKERKIIL